MYPKLGLGAFHVDKPFYMNPQRISKHPLWCNVNVNADDSYFNFKSCHTEDSNIGL